VILALPFLVITGLVLPVLAWSSHRRQASAETTDEAVASLGAMALNTIILQAILAGLGWLAIEGMDIAVSWRSHLAPIPVLAAAGLVSLGLAMAWRESRRPDAEANVVQRTLRGASPASPAWLTTALVAGVGEEFAYRGVLTGLLSVTLGAPAGWVTSAVLFGLGHFTQGWRGFLYSAGYALALQGIVFLSGGLALAIVAHVAYDLGAVWLSGLKDRRDDEMAGQ
jgi:membrane protease YdiL (CAAX protease family)